jgi:hypothetical protein
VSGDRQKINYAKAVLWRQYSGPQLTAGALVSGKLYLVKTLGTGADFSNLGGPKRATCSATLWIPFTATGTTPTAWGSSVLIEFKIDELRALAADTFSQATATVTLTRAGFEGGDGSGEITFEKTLLGRAIEELIAQYAPSDAPPFAARRRAGGIIATF